MRSSNIVDVPLRGRRLTAEVLCVVPKRLKLDKHVCLEYLHDLEMARRQRLQASQTAGMFKVKSSSSLPKHEEATEAELAAQKIAAHKRLIVTDSQMGVIHGHRSAILEIESGAQAVVILRVREKLNAYERFLIQIRFAAKEGQLYPADRVESIRILIDNFGATKKEVRLLLEGPKGKCPSLREVAAELRVGQIYESYPGYRIPRTGFALDRRAFSTLKLFAGNKTVNDAMLADRNTEEHFVNMAVTAANKRSSRLHDDLYKLLEHDDTQQELMTKGLQPALDLHKARYPEENHDQHPQHDLVSVNAKLRNPETVLLLEKQLQKSPSANQALKEVLEINEFFANFPGARKELLRSLYALDPCDYADVIVDLGPEVFHERLLAKRNLLHRIGKAQK